MKKKCKYCKDGRIIVNKQKGIVFCTLCGHEFRVRLSRV